MLRDLLLSSSGGTDRSLGRCLLYFIPIAAIALFVHRDLYAGRAPLTGVSHAQRSFDAAVNAAYCGKPDWYSARYSVHTFLTTRPDLMSHPMRNVVAAQAVSVDDYCVKVNDPIVLEENSLHWLERFALWSNAHMTPDHLVQFLGACRMCMLLVFGFALLRSGASVLFSLASVVIAGDVAGGARDTAYTFAMALPLLHAGLYGIALSLEAIKRRGAGLWVFALGMGVLTAFSAGMRTNQMPIGIGMFAVFLAAIAWRARRPVTMTPLIAAVVAFAVGYGAYMAVFVVPLRNPKLENYIYHPFAHPLVLGLGVPENELSRREGIQWNDEVGLAIAKRVVPDVAYLGPHYDTALLEYYGGLWRREPREMLSVYLLKLRSTGSGVFLSAANVATRYLVPHGIGEWLDRLTNGVVLVGLALAMFVVGVWRYSRGAGNRLLIVSLLGLTALASFWESWMTYSLYVGLYFSIQLFFVFFAALVAIQAAVDAAARRWPRPVSPAPVI
ncbi:MAG TPA: hypothetical protein VG871_18555 [Vicinamibacterales bacterium]|nr:hypothetical protein [Vicinamibacterales bacterium]